MKYTYWLFALLMLLILIESHSQNLNFNIKDSSNTLPRNLKDTLKNNISAIERTGPFHIKNKGIKIYPNPTEGDLFIEYEFATGYETIEILDLLGLKVLVLPLETSINIGSLVKGVYFLRLLDRYNRLIVMERIIKK